MDASSFKSSLDPKNSRAERDDSGRFEGIIHIVYLFGYLFIARSSTDSTAHLGGDEGEL
jgi:hypothetical protein